MATITQQERKVKDFRNISLLRFPVTLLFTGAWTSVLCGAVWTGADSGAVLSVTGEQACPNETDKTASVSDTLHTSAEHRGPGPTP